MKPFNFKKIILASGSPRRAQLLRMIGLQFEVMESRVPEDLNLPEEPVAHVVELSRRKALEVAKRVEEGIIIGADTIVVLEEAILGKPTDQEEAKDMLSRLSGKTHRVYTGFTLLEVPSLRSLSDWEVTEVKFRELEPWEIEEYVRSGSPLDKAGAYGIQDRSAVFVERINGCYYNVVGFPLMKFYQDFLEFLKSL